MGSCVSFSRSPPATSTAKTADKSSHQRPVSAAKVVNLDGSMAQFAGPVVTASEALRALCDGGGRSSSPRRFLCSSDELGFDAPPHALAPHEALQPGQLYFVLPAPMLRRPLSGNDMAALAIKAATALAVDAGPVTSSSSPRRKEHDGAAAGKGRRRRKSSAARVAPLLVVSSNDDDTHGGFTARKAEQDGDRTVWKARRQGAAGRRSGGARRRPNAQRLSAIAEDGE
ncbi:hypothetical protein HU200_000919 [Digitaria exilis]|uniref:Uncharacterized protein n=1 Tax=Digitaria exilis TaxID=1010633 RepID=A0A835KWS8_9POAL|nr:hypothetical protein HU200_000919 [Digitaria exilis]